MNSPAPKHPMRGRGRATRSRAAIALVLVEAISVQEAAARYGVTAAAVYTMLRHEPIQLPKKLHRGRLAARIAKRTGVSLAEAAREVGCSVVHARVGERMERELAREQR